MKRKSLSFRLEEPTEKELLAEIDEFFFSLMHSLRNPTVEDFVAAAKIFFAPVVRKALQRTKAENRSVRKANSDRQWKSKRAKKAALVVAARLMQEHPQYRLSRRRSRLADAVSKRTKEAGHRQEG
jgi:hypothetical protein